MTKIVQNRDKYMRRQERWLIKGIFLTICLAFAYLGLRVFFFLFSDLPLFEKLLVFCLLFAEFFGFIHLLGYFINVRKVFLRKKERLISHDPPILKEYPPIAILLPSYKEPLEVIQDTLVCFYNISYPNKHLYYLDDSRYEQLNDTLENVQKYRQAIEQICKTLEVNLFRRNWRGAKAGIINDFLHFLDGDQPPGLEYHHFGQDSQKGNEKYILVFDADMCPLPHFIEILVAYMENDAKIAIIQTPQYYSNFEYSRVAKAAGLQQVIFCEYICEGKGLDHAMFCCGTNFIIRRDALLSVGGFDESSVTEDFATSLKLHLNGWKLLYYNRIMTFGMGPEDLYSYFKQQFRWAVGTLSMWRPLLHHFIRHREKCSLIVWWEYFLSSTYYYIGCIYFCLFLFPVIFIFFSIPSVFIWPDIYFTALFLHMGSAIIMLLSSLSQRHFTPVHLIYSTSLSTIAFPVYIKAAFFALLGKKATFTVTPKKGGHSMPLKALWPQITALVICGLAIVWGIGRINTEQELLWGLIANVCWCIWNFVILFSLFYFNRSSHTQDDIWSGTKVSSAD